MGSYAGPGWRELLLTWDMREESPFSLLRQRGFVMYMYLEPRTLERVGSITEEWFTNTTVER